MGNAYVPCSFIDNLLKNIEISVTFKPTLADPAERTVIEYSDRSMTVLWPRIITANNAKKYIKRIAIMILLRNLD